MSDFLMRKLRTSYQNIIVIQEIIINYDMKNLKLHYATTSYEKLRIIFKNEWLHYENTYDNDYISKKFQKSLLSS